MRITIEFSDDTSQEYVIENPRPYLLMVSLGAKWAWSSPIMDCYSTPTVTFMIHRPA